MPSHHASFRWLVVFAAVAGLAGCSDPYAGQTEVTGTVTLAGEPLKDGSITFEPLEGQGTKSGAPITEGTYTVPRKNGLKPGKYLVKISAGDGRTPAHANEEEAGAPGGSTNIVSVDMVPDEWNSKSKKEVQVKANAVNKLDFAIPNVNPRARRR